MLLVSEHGLSSLPMRLALLSLRAPARLYTACSWRAALEVCAGHRRFGLIALDLDIEGGGRLRGLQALHRLQPGASLIALVSQADGREARTALAQGAVAYLARHESISTLVQALRTAVPEQAHEPGQHLGATSCDRIRSKMPFETSGSKAHRRSKA
jgi:DNA-binding NarL/FixJ family response regulator